jgi:hypothetical protein
MENHSFSPEALPALSQFNTATPDALHRAKRTNERAASGGQNL